MNKYEAKELYEELKPYKNKIKSIDAEFFFEFAEALLEENKEAK